MMKLIERLAENYFHHLIEVKLVERWYKVSDQSYNAEMGFVSPVKAAYQAGFRKAREMALSLQINEYADEWMIEQIKNLGESED